MLRAQVATVEATRDVGPGPSAGARLGRWARWWRGGTTLDWGYAVLCTALIAASYDYAWLTRNTLPLPSGAEVPFQAAWLAVTLWLGASGVLTWRREGALRSL